MIGILLCCLFALAIVGQSSRFHLVYSPRTVTKLSSWRVVELFPLCGGYRCLSTTSPFQSISCKTCLTHWTVARRSGVLHFTLRFLTSDIEIARSPILDELLEITQCLSVLGRRTLRWNNNTLFSVCTNRFDGKLCVLLSKIVFSPNMIHCSFMKGVPLILPVCRTSRDD